MRRFCEGCGGCHIPVVVAKSERQIARPGPLFIRAQVECSSPREFERFAIRSLRLRPSAPPATMIASANNAGTAQDVA